MFATHYDVHNAKYREEPQLTYQVPGKSVVDGETEQPGSESHGARLSMLCARGTAAGRGGREASMLTIQLRGRKRDMHRRARMLPAAAERIAMIRDVAF